MSDLKLATNRPCNSPPLTVTFDSNTLDAVVFPRSAQRENGPFGAIVRDAIQDGRIRGFFSETIITLEGIEREDRAAVLGETQVVVEATSVEIKPGPSVSFTFSVGSQHIRQPLTVKALARVQGALELDIRPLRTAARWVGYHANTYPLFEPPGGMPELLRCLDKVNEMTTAITTRGLGQAKALELGLHFSKRDDVSTPELWLQGLGRARNKSERNKVYKATREWADGDSIAAHHGFGMQLFCSEDVGRSGHSILDGDNRKWLSEEFGIEFVTLAQLAQRVTE